jgi:hypothetical protein
VGFSRKKEINMENKKGFKNVIGEVYNRFIIIGHLPSIKYGKNSYKAVKARCECGNERDLCYRELTRGDRKSCGCYAESLKNKIDEGDEFGLWTVVKETEGYFYKGEKATRSFLCRCICGKEGNINMRSLLTGDSKSCGCQGRPKKEIKERIFIIPKDTEEEQWKECVSYPNYYISTLGNLFNYKSQLYLKKSDKYSIKIRKLNS